MNCDLVDNWFGVRYRAADQADFGLMTRCITRDRRFRWMFVNGGYTLHRANDVPATDHDLIVATALRGQTAITETLNYQGIFFPASQGFALRALGPQGVKDDAATPGSHQINLVFPPGGSPSEIFPQPAPPISVSVAPGVNGTIVVTVNVNNILAVTPAVELSIYTDGGTGGGINYGAPLGAREPVGASYGEFSIVRDPGLGHGATLSVAVLTRSASGVESDQAAESSTPQDVVIDSQGPPAMAGLAAGTVC